MCSISWAYFDEVSNTHFNLVLVHIVQYIFHIQETLCSLKGHIKIKWVFKVNRQGKTVSALESPPRKAAEEWREWLQCKTRAYFTISLLIVTEAQRSGSHKYGVNIGCCCSERNVTQMKANGIEQRWKSSLLFSGRNMRRHRKC